MAQPPRPLSPGEDPEKVAALGAGRRDALPPACRGKTTGGRGDPRGQAERKGSRDEGRREEVEQGAWGPRAGKGAARAVFRAVLGSGAKKQTKKKFYAAVEDRALRVPRPKAASKFRGRKESPEKGGEEGGGGRRRGREGGEPRVLLPAWEFRSPRALPPLRPPRQDRPSV